MYCIDLSSTHNSHQHAFELWYALLIHCTDLALTLTSHYCESELHYATFMHSTNLPSTLSSRYCVSKLCSAHLVNLYTYLALTFDGRNCASEVCFAFSFIAQTTISLLTGIIAHSSSVLLFLCISCTLISF